MAAVELHARTLTVAVRALGELLEGRCDQGIDSRWLSPKTLSRVAAARQGAQLEPERFGVTVRPALYAGAIFAPTWVKQSVEPAARRDPIASSSSVQARVIEGWSSAVRTNITRTSRRSTTSCGSSLTPSRILRLLPMF